MINYIDYAIDSGILGIIIISLTVCGLMYVASHKEEDEIYLGIKIIGLYLIGGFNFNININLNIPIVIPIGFLVYYVFIKDKIKINSKTKKKAAILGLIMLYIGLINTTIYDYIEYRDIIIKTSNQGYSKIEKDWQDIKDVLKCDLATVTDLSLVYDDNKNIKSLTYNVQDNKKHYLIKYIGKSDGYSVYKVDINKVYINREAIKIEDDNRKYDISIDMLISIIGNIQLKDSDNIDEHHVYYNYDANLIEKKDIQDIYEIDLGDYSINKINEIKEMTDTIEGVFILYTAIENHSKDMYKHIIEDVYLLDYIDK